MIFKFSLFSVILELFSNRYCLFCLKFKMIDWAASRIILLLIRLVCSKHEGYAKFTFNICAYLYSQCDTHKRKFRLRRRISKHAKHTIFLLTLVNTYTTYSSCFILLGKLDSRGNAYYLNDVYAVFWILCNLICTFLPYQYMPQKRF